MRHLKARIFPSMILQQTTPARITGYAQGSAVAPWGRIVLGRRRVAAFHTEYFT